MTVCATPIKGTVFRVVAVDACGVPVTGGSSAVFVNDGFISIGFSPQFEEGTEFILRNADGQIIVNQKDDSAFKRFAVTVTMAKVDPELMAYLMNTRTLSVGSPLVTGAGFSVKSGQWTNRVSLEVWQRVAGSGACSASGQQQYVYHALPNVGAIRIGDDTIENNPSQLSWTAETADPSTLWGDGPGSGTSWITPAVVQTLEHRLWAITTTAPPTATCGKATLT
jgi:hypothetical protein